MKKRLATLIAGLSVFAMTSASFAANTANVSVTSEPIRQAATCDKAGGFAITFDDQTTFTGGDQITADLDFGVTLCRDIDLEIGINGNIAGNDASNFTFMYTLPALGSGNPIETSDVASTLTSANGGVLFKVTGTAGASRVTIDVMTDVNGDGTLESSNTAWLKFNGAAATDVIELSFLDQAIYAPAAGAAGIFAPNATTGIYDGNNATAAQNTLCIDVSDPTYTDTKVNANLDSKADKFTWIPSNPQVAHVVAASQFQFEECKTRNAGKILMPGSAVQGSTVTCTTIENDADAADGTDAFCFSVAADQHRKNKMIIRTANGSAFESVNYQVQLDILVNGAEGANGVYWTNEQVATTGYTTSALACAATQGDGTNVGVATYTLADGNAATPVATDEDCTIAASAKAVRLVTPASTLNLAATDSYLYINLPKMAFDSSEFTDGDVLSVKVTLIKAPCGELFTGTWEIGTAGCSAATVSNSLTFPYFAKAGAYANAIIVTNTSATAGTATFTIYEMDGDVFTAQEAVAANGMFVNLLGNLTMTPAAGTTGTFGDTKCYVTVSTDFAVDGAAMITNPSTGESIGYLPRQ